MCLLQRIGGQSVKPIAASPGTAAAAAGSEACLATTPPPLSRRALLERQAIHALAGLLEHDRIARFEPALLAPFHHAGLLRRARAEDPGAIMNGGLERPAEIGLDRDRLHLVGTRRILGSARSERVRREEFEDVPERHVALGEGPDVLGAHRDAALLTHLLARARHVALEEAFDPLVEP